MKNVIGVVSVGCVVALMAALVPATASGATETAPQAGTSSVDARKKPKPPKPPTTAPVPIQAKMVGEWVTRNWASLGNATPRFTYFVEPAVKGSPWEALTLAGAEEAFAIHKALGYPIERDFRVYMGWDRQWLVDNLPPDACPGGSWGPANQCWGTNVILMNFAAWAFYDTRYSIKSGPGPADRIHVVGQLPHELTHMVQEQISPRAEERLWSSDSKWLIEGWAMFVQLIAAAKIYNIPYATARDYHLQSMGTRCVVSKLKDLLESNPYQNCEYLNGHLAMEYLVWKTGDMAAGLTYVKQDAETPHEAFQMAFSLDLEAFMEEADRYVAQEINLWKQRKPPPAR